jgi:hypothetical protein
VINKKKVLKQQQQHQAIYQLETVQELPELLQKNQEKIQLDNKFLMSTNKN